MQEKARDQKPEARITPSLIMDYAKVQRERDEAAAEIARLRAELDELLAACKLFLSLCATNGMRSFKGWPEAMSQARAAIAKCEEGRK